MQTFLPSPDFEESASILDNRRLGKQRIETLQIMNALITGRGAWTNHPATKMWRGYEFSLLEYQFAMCWEWHIMRGYEDSCLEKTYKLFWTKPHLYVDHCDPFWLGDDDFHWRHQSNLLRKDPKWYGDFVFDKDLPDNLEYYWPVE